MGDVGNGAAQQKAFEAMLLAQVRDAVVAADENARVTYVNRAAEETLGPRNPRVGWPVAELFEARGVADEMSTDDYAGQVRCRRRDGSPFHASVRSTLLRYPGRSSRGFVLSIRETDRTEVDLRRSEELLRMAQRAAMVGIWELDPVTQALSWTPELEILYGYEPGGVHVYSDWSRRVNANDLRRIEAERASALAEHRPFDLEFRLEYPPGKTRWLKARGGAIYDECGRPVRIFGITLDVSDRKRLEEALRESNRKDEFLSVLSHELRNPLMPIKNALAILERSAYGGEQAKRAQAIIGRQVHHLTCLVDDLLDVTRIASGKVQLDRRRVNLGEVVRSTVEDYRTTFEHGGVGLTDAVSFEPMWLMGDATRIAQIVGNLLANAAKFTPPGGRVRLTLERDLGAATLRVLDDGPGIDPRVRDRLFEPFVQAPQTSDRQTGGLGLGLALVKGFVQLHGGAVDVSSAARGAQFTVRLPLEAEQTGQTAHAADAAHTAHADAPLRRRRVLVIDDNLDAAETLRDLLELTGYEVRTAGDGPEGLTLARSFRPQVVLCDIGLPGMDGYQVANAFRADADQGLHGVRMVALTGYSLPEDRRRTSEAGFAGHVGKPPDLDELNRLLESES